MMHLSIKKFKRKLFYRDQKANIYILSCVEFGDALLKRKPRQNTLKV